MSATTEEFIAALHNFLGLRYFSIVPFLVVAFDHIITLPDEIQCIWTNHNVNWKSRAAFFANRYPPLGVLAVVVYIFSGTSVSLTTKVCQKFLWVYGVACIIAGATSHFIIILRIHRLWDRRKNVERVLTVTFMVCISTITILGIFAVLQLEPQLSYFAPLQTCRFGSKPKVVTGMLAVLSMFDFALVLLLVFNAMDRPRRTNVQIISDLQKDGMGFFLAICALRFADVLFSVYEGTAEVFLAITMVWGLCTLINARLHIRLEGLALLSVSGHQRPVIMLEDM